MKYILYIFIIFFAKTTFAQNESRKVKVCNKMAEFKGGNEEMWKFISSNLKYPIEAKQNKWEGKVWVKFTIDTLGKIMNLVLVKSSGFKNLDEEAIRVVNLMPLWSPAMIENKFKNQEIVNFPIQFKLE